MHSVAIHNSQATVYTDTQHRVYQIICTGLYLPSSSLSFLSPSPSSHPLLPLSLSFLSFPSPFSFLSFSSPSPSSPPFPLYLSLPPLLPSPSLSPFPSPPPPSLIFPVSIEKVARITSPVLVVHGTDDEVIDFSHGLAIYERAPRTVEPLWVEGAGHNDVELYGQYLERLRKFLYQEIGTS